MAGQPGRNGLAGPKGEPGLAGFGRPGVTGQQIISKHSISLGFLLTLQRKCRYGCGLNDAYSQPLPKELLFTYTENNFLLRMHLARFRHF